jgi:23S rRNA (guanosine2251-2'-O)-methyltransferase
MTPGLIAFYECRQPTCQLRFPAQVETVSGCPRCGRPLVAVGEAVYKYPPAEKNGRLPPIHLLLDNIRSLHNVGSIFRTADGAGVGHLYLCGITPTPANPRLAKTALGAQNTVHWSYHNNALAAAVSLQQAGHALWGIEPTPASQPLFAAPPLPAERPLVLLLGNEKAGLDPGLLALCEQTIHLPMYGHKTSLNVAVVAGTAVYYLMMREA